MWLRAIQICAGNALSVLIVLRSDLMSYVVRHGKNFLVGCQRLCA